MTSAMKMVIEKDPETVAIDLSGNPRKKNRGGGVRDEEMEEEI